MLTFLRNMLSNRFVGGFFIVLLVLAFAFFAVPDLNNFAQSSPLRVGEVRYSAAEIQEEYNRQIENFRRETGNQITRDEAPQFGLTEQAVQALIYRSAIRQETQALRMTVTTEALQDYLQSLPGLQNPRTGRFDNEALQFVLREYELSIGEFRQIMREELIRNQLMASLSAPVQAPDAFINPLLLQISEERAISLVEITPDSLGERPEPTAEDLQSFYSDNADRYRAPAYRSFRAMLLRNEDLKQGLSIPEEDLRAIFEIRRDQLETPETRSILQLTYGSEEEAEAALARLAAGTPFEALAEERGLTLDLVTSEDVRQSELDVQLGEAVFALENEGDVAGPVQNVFGYRIAQLLSVTEGTSTTFEEQRETLETQALQEQIGGRLLDLVEQIEIARDEGATISEALEDVPQTGLTAFGPVDENLMTPGGAIVDGLPTEVLAEAYLLEPGDESELLEFEDGTGYFAVIVDDVVNPALRPYDEVAPQVRSDWEADWNRREIAMRISAVEEAVAAGADIEVAASERGLASQPLRFTRQQAVTRLPVDFTTDVFHASLGELVSHQSEDGQRGLVVRVANATFPPNLQGDLFRDIYRQNGGQIISQPLVNAYIETIESDLGVRRNDERLAQIFGSEQR